MVVCMCVLQAQNLAAYYTPSQIFNPCLYLHWAAQTIQPQSETQLSDFISVLQLLHSVCSVCVCMCSSLSTAASQTAY